MSSLRCSISLLALLQVSLGFGHTKERPTVRFPRNAGVSASLGKFPTSRHSSRHVERQFSHLQNKHSACSPLKNHGTHFTVELEVGTPGQKFDVVADTGSDAVIVPSCSCLKAGYCDEKSRCFQGTNRSSTFVARKSGPPVVRMRFGSGPVQAVLVTDVVGVGGVRTKMEDSVLLMTDHQLQIPSPFEGILGLGVPAGGTGSKKGLYRATIPGHGEKNTRDQTGYAADEADTKDRKIGTGSEVRIVPPRANISKSAARKSFDPSKTMRNTTAISIKGFIGEAGVDRFSICFNDGKPGVMRLNTPPSMRPHGSLGRVHWGLGFYGISVGSYHSSVLFCNNQTHKSQKSPCGMIPDSGTTAILAPKEHLLSLYAGICDRWPRCLKNFTALESAAKRAKKLVEDSYGYDPWQIAGATKEFVFQHLIRDCKSWLQKDKQLDELPPMYFHVRGSGGTKQTLKLHGWSYIIQRHEKDFEYVYKDVPGFGKVPVKQKPTGETHLVCSPAFGEMDYRTEENGPVWIVGTPAFYEYQVGYDVKSNPPSISFHKCGGCGTCHEKASMVDTSVAEGMADSPRCITDTSLRVRPPRQVIGPWRVPTIDMTSPL